MGYLKEPKGVDFVIASEPLTDNARQEISEFIRAYKSKIIDGKRKSTTTSSKRNTKEMQS